MDALAALRLQIEWGADEALDEAPVDRTQAPVVAVAAPRGSVAPSAPPAHAAPPAKLGAAARAQQVADAAPTIEALRIALAGFTDCPLAVTATHLVFADGNPQARLVFVGDIPGPEEDASGTPMVGQAGALLDRMLASIGLDRSRLLITTLVPWRPPGGRPPSDSEIALCAPFLLRHLALLDPRIVVTLGQLPARVLTGSDASIRKLRGKWQTLSLGGGACEVKLLPMLHPAQLLRTPTAKREAWNDLLALQQALNSI
jgi:uracil-DNA glycosylase family 4